MSALELFPFQDRDVRVLHGDDGEPWFVAADVARELGYKTTNAATRILDADMKGAQIVRTLGGDQRFSIISESGLYRLVMRSQKTEAREFERHVVKVILPSIRKTGAYVPVIPAQRQPEPMPALPATYLDALKELVVTVERAAAAEQKAIEATERVAELEPAAELWNTLATVPGAHKVGDAAKYLRNAGFDLGQNKLFKLLDSLGWIYRAGDGAWRAKQTQVDNGRLVELPMTRPERDEHGRKVGDKAAPPQVQITGKGLAALANHLTQQRLSAVQAVAAK